MSYPDGIFNVGGTTHDFVITIGIHFVYGTEDHQIYEMAADANVYRGKMLLHK
jgi:hypothetical protein